LLSIYKNKLEILSLIPSSGGAFEVTLDEKLIYSKKELGRFPEDQEVENLIALEF